MGTVEPIDRPFPPETAEDWVARLMAPDCTAGDREGFARWEAASAENGAAHAEVEQIYEESAGLRVDPVIVAATRAALRGPEPSGRARWLVPLAVAASVLVAVIGLAVYRLSPWAPAWGPAAAPAPAAALEIPYSTPVGEQLTITLADGSTIFLDTESSVVVRTDDHERSVRLLSGRAEFKVVHDLRHPFTVDVGVGTIRDVGTEFTARRDGGQVTVTVEEGAVAVESAPAVGAIRSAQLAPRDQLKFDGSGTLWTTRQVDLEAVTGWTRGELTFDDRPLADIVAEMNRYTHAKLQIADAKLGALHISGVFHAGDQPSLVQALRTGWGIRARREPSGDVTLYRRGVPR